MSKFEILGLIFSFAGGLGMFLYGMNVMADGLQKSAGNKLKQLLGYLTRNPFIGAIVGMLVTSIIQSSSATTVMVVGFVNAGLMNLSQAVGVIMGANIGTTVTAWLVSMNEWGALFKPDFFAPLLVGIGAFTILFSGKKEKRKDIGEILVGFGLLFIGLNIMSDVIKPFQDSPVFSKAFVALGRNPLLGILVGVIVTAIIQSSSASVGILQTLAMNGVVNWSSAIFITLGQNIGTCVTAMLSSIGANKTAKRAATIHLLFNVVGAVIFGIIMYIVFMVSPQFASSKINSVEISMFHTVFNLTNTIILFPFAELLVKLSGVFIREKTKVDDEDEYEVSLRHLDERIFKSPSFAVENVIKEIVNLGKITFDNTKNSIEALLENDEQMANRVFEVEKVIDKHTKLIIDYLIKITNLSLTEKQHLIVKNLFYTVSNIERVGDHAENIAELAIEKIENSIHFSDQAYRELKEICDTTISALENAIKARETGNITYVANVEQMEKMVDVLWEDLRQAHIERLSQGICNSETGIIFIDTLTNLERISDHSLNIAQFIEDDQD
ncbi:MAG: Na/Pi cotransporter family protein [Clostridiales bacterium]|nr:Na/Pi cotransporter family protein [Clostridiales bacterium]